MHRIGFFFKNLTINLKNKKVCGKKTKWFIQNQEPFIKFKLFYYCKQNAANWPFLWPFPFIFRVTMRLLCRVCLWLLHEITLWYIFSIFYLNDHINLVWLRFIIFLLKFKVIYFWRNADGNEPNKVRKASDIQSNNYTFYMEFPYVFLWTLLSLLKSYWLFYFCLLNCWFT